MFGRKILIPLAIDEAFSFFADAKNLELITPEFLAFRILTPTPIVMQSGTLIDYQIRLFGFKMRWRTLIEAYDSPNSFVDTQVTGPYKMWHHTHSFRSVPDGTEMTDTVKYQIRYGLLGEFARRLFVQRTLKRIFDYRTEKIAEHMKSRQVS
jgi:ligand-binding SRPBCC domain-containing protein